MSGFDQSQNLASKITPTNIFESLMLSNTTVASTPIEQAQNFLNQVFYNSSFHSIMPSTNLFNPGFYASPNYPVSSFNLNHQYKQNNSFSMQMNKSLEKKDSELKNIQRLKYLDDLISSSVQTSNLELEKTLIYEHRLFPLLKFMFEKCELATLNPDLLATTDKKINISSSNYFDIELKKFLKDNELRLIDQSLDKVIKNSSNEHLKQVYLSVNELIMNVILVLRINLIEIEKVNELCTDFVGQYVEALKVKLNSDNIFNIDDDEEEEDRSNEFDEQDKSGSGAKLKRCKKNAKKSAKSSMDLCTSTPIKYENQTYEISPNVSLSKIKFNMLSADKSDNSCLSDASNNLSIEEESNNFCDDEHQYLNDSTNIQEDLDEFDENVSIKSHVSTYVEKSSSSSSSCINKSYSSNNDDSLNSKNKRGVLPKSATNVMKKWLFQHIVHPYPTEEEKRQIAIKTNLTLIQVNNWFINARRRILQPMLEASNPDLTKKKKSSQVSSIKPYQNSRYWPPSLSHLGQKSSKAESEKYCQNTYEDGPIAKKLKTGNESSQREVDQSSTSEKSQKGSDQLYQHLYSQFNTTCNVPSIQLLANKPVCNFDDIPQSSKSSSQKQKSFRIENLIGNDDTKKNDETKFIEFMQQQFYQQIQCLNQISPSSSFSCVTPGSSFLPHQKP